MQKGYLLQLYIFCLLLPLISFGGGWYEQQDPGVTNTINTIVTEDQQGQLLFAVGDGGMILMSKDGGHAWVDISYPANFENLHDIAVYYGIPDTVLIAVGDNGTILRSVDFGFTWSQNDTLTTVSLYAAAYDNHLGTFIIGGDGSEIYFSYDLGLSWLPGTIEGSMMQIREIIPTVHGVYLAGLRNDTTFVQTNGDTGIVYAVDHTLPDIILQNADEAFGNLYFAGYRASTGEGVIDMRVDGGSNWDIPSIFTPAGIGNEITSIKGMEAAHHPLWVATSNGFIYESDLSATNFTPVYQNDMGEHINSIAACYPDSPRPLAWAGGSSGLLLRYDFTVIFLSPAPNQLMAISQDRFQIQFSAIPEETSLSSGIHLHSSIQGDVPFTVAYQADSTYVDLIVTSGTIPGEQWTVILSNQILEQDFTTGLQPFHYTTTVGTAMSSDLSYDAPMAIQTIGGPITNYVTGFFNDDDSFDLIAFARDTLFCFQGIGDGTFNLPVSIYIGPAITVNTSIKQQLQTADINRDGFPDLYLFDRNGIQLIQNTSASAFGFTPNAYLAGPNIRDVALFSINDNALFDIVIVSDSLYIRSDISMGSFGSIIASDNGMGWQQIAVGDIDLDGRDDFAAINSSGELIFRHMMDMGTYDTEISFIGPFHNIKLADLDSDGELDVIAQRDSILVSYYYQSFWNFPPGPSLVQESILPVQDFLVTDLNGDFLPDVAAATSNQLIKFFRNMTSGEDLLNFAEETPFQMTADMEITHLLFGDYDQEGTTDLVFSHPDAGDFQIARKSSGMMISWQPVIDSVAVFDARVFLRWSQFPDTLGTFEFYRLYHDTLSYSFSNYTDIFIQADTMFIDSTLTPGKTRWYRVEAYYNGGMISDVSEEIAVDVFTILEGSLSGTLTDTNAFYFVPNHIQIDAGQSLTIFPNIVVVFDSAASFDVYGSLEISGTEDQMVAFSGSGHDAYWHGIHMAPGVDTVRLSWFHMENARQAFSIIDRPVKISFGAVEKCETAFNLQGNAFLALQHIFIAENDFGIQAFDDAGIDLKNLTIVDNKYEAIRTLNNARIKGRNLIIWHNNFGDMMVKGPDISNHASQMHILRYSTIDSLYGSYDLYEIQQLAPVFKPVESDSMRFFPDEMSPTIDAGDPLDDFSLEPMPNGGRINQGVYGGLTYATPSLQPRLFVDNTPIQIAAQVGESAAYSLRLHNRGYVDLVIHSIERFISAFSLNDLAFPMIIPAGDSSIVEINFSPLQENVFFDTLFIRCNDPHLPKKGLMVAIEGNSLEGPKFTAELDTLIYTYVSFTYQVKTDISNDQSCLFHDNTSLFDIDSLTGTIHFTPRRQDVGRHMVVVSLIETDIARQPQQDTLIFDIKLNPVNPVQNLSATAGDQQITLHWDNPVNQFYTRTRLHMRMRTTNDEWDAAIIIADTAFTKNSSSIFTANKLQTDREYQFEITNYYAPPTLDGDQPVNSDAIQLTSRTTAPKISFNLSQREVYVPPGDTLRTSLKIKNDGDGTLFCNFNYQPDSLQKIWFNLDTTQKRILPHDSILVPYQVHPVYQMIDQPHQVTVQIITNQRDWLTRSTTITLHILFDRIAPRVTMLEQPGEKHSYAAVRFDFTARDDTVLHGWHIGDPPDKLRMRYRFSDLQNSRVEADTGLVLQSLEFYPLIDGHYRFALWIYDQEANGFAAPSATYNLQFEVKASARTFNSNQWHLASFPRHQKMALNTFFSDSSAHVFRWHNGDSKYIPFADSTLKGGEGVWVLTLQDKEIDVNAIKLDASIDSTVITLKKGWNQIGVPTAYPLDFGMTKLRTSEAQIVGITEAIRGRVISPAIYWYRSTKKYAGYEWAEMDTAKVYPWQGYWIHAAYACQIMVVHKPALQKKESPVATKIAVNATSSNDWRLNLQLYNDEYCDNRNIIGASSATTFLPVYEPPPLQDYCALSFVSQSGALTRDLRQPFTSMEEVKTWDMVVASSHAAQQHTINRGPIPPHMKIYFYLVDPAQEKIVDLLLDSSYTFIPKNKTYTLNLYATQDASFRPKIIPLTYRLAQNYPNPFNPSTTIKFGIPPSGAGKQVNITIYNILGQKVITLLDKKMTAGYYTVEWSATNHEGNQVASGLYFYRLRSDNHILVKKMIVLR